MKRSKHNLSHHRLASFDMGQLVPIANYEVLPGDTIRQSTSVMLRVAATVNPLMHPVTVRAHHFFVPWRLCYDAIEEDKRTKWDEWLSGAETDATDQLKEFSIVTADCVAGTLANHLGLPTGTTDMDVNAIPFVAYQMIYNEYYRDHELQTEIDLQSESACKTLRRICWEKDYFTAARLTPQFGATSVSIPFEAGLVAPITGIAMEGTLDTIFEGQTGLRETTPSTTTSYPFSAEMSEASQAHIKLDSATEATAKPLIYADLANATGGGIDVNEFRRAMALQKFLEARSRFGSRYRDYLAYLGVRTSDKSMSGPVYLGGGKQHVAFSEVLATADSATSEVGDMSGHGIAALRTRPFTRFFEEHGQLLTLLSVRPKSMYMNQLHRQWFRDTKDDIWHKEYEAFGPQTVVKKEIYALHTNETDVFGYTDRFREYREHPSYVSGEFGTTRDDWHLAREFTAVPTLDTDFISCTPTDRVYNDTSQPELYCMARHSIVARRLVSKGPR